MGMVLAVLLTLAAPAAQEGSLLEDVCAAVKCDASLLPALGTPEANVRVLALREASAKPDATVETIYEALGSSRAPGSAGAPAEAMDTVRELLGLSPSGGNTMRTLGIPQQEVGHPHPYLLERSMLFPFQKGLILEAQVAPHLYFYESLTKPNGVELHGGNAIGISVTPMFKVRIRHEKSSPVQTLSFMPKLNLQYFRLPPKAEDAPWGGKTGKEPVWLKGGLFVWGHHSNGQTECLYQQGVLDGECTPPSSAADVRINYPNGSFSTNYLKFAVFATRLRLGRVSQAMTPGPPIFQQKVQKKTTFAAWLELNPLGLPPGGSLDEPARSLYGPTRIGVNVEHEQRACVLGCGSWRFSGTGEYFNKVANVGSSRWRFTGEVGWEPDWFHAGGFVARYVHGQDYYNLQFDRNIHWFQVGLVFSASEFERFTSREPPKKAAR